MEFKQNEATPNRPSGDRTIDALYLKIDMEAYIKQLKEEKAWHKNDRNGITVFKTDHLTIVLTVLHENAEIKENTIDGLVTIQVMQGVVRVTTIDGDFELNEKQLVTVHQNEQHSILALKESALLISNYTDKLQS